MKEIQYDPKKLLNVLNFSFKGDYEKYESVVLEATRNDPFFLAKVINYNRDKSEIKDSKVALPILALRNLDLIDNERVEKEVVENAIANLMLLSPRDLVKAYEYNKKLSKSNRVIRKGWRTLLNQSINKYLEIRENYKPWWDRCVLTHRKYMKHLYTISHRKPSEYVQRILFDKDYPENSVFYKLKHLHLLNSKEQAAFIINSKIPFISVFGALKTKKEDLDPFLVLALIEQMTGQQLVANAKMISSLGLDRNPWLKVAYQEAFNRAVDDERVTISRASKAINIVNTLNKEETYDKLVELQEKKLDNSQIEGNWVILGDCSGSMNLSIDLSKLISSYVARVVKGKVYLIFFHTLPLAMDVTGKTLEEIKNMTYSITSGGGTVCGCGLELLREKRIEVDGIAIITDGGDHGVPEFYKSYKRYCEELLIQPSIYMYKVPGEYDTMSQLCKANNVDINIHDLRSGRVTEDSLRYMVSTMRISKFGLIEEISDTPLLTINEAFNIITDKYGEH